HRRTRGRAVEEGLATRSARPRCDGADPPDQGRARPARDPQPGRRPLTAPGSPPSGTNPARAAVPTEVSTELRHNAADTRFEIYLDGSLAGYADYAETESPKVRNFHRTITFPEFRGRG